MLLCSRHPISTAVSQTLPRAESVQESKRFGHLLRLGLPPPRYSRAVQQLQQLGFCSAIRIYTPTTFDMQILGPHEYVTYCKATNTAAPINAMHALHAYTFMVYGACDSSPPCTMSESIPRSSITEPSGAIASGPFAPSSPGGSEPTAPGAAAVDVSLTTAVPLIVPDVAQGPLQGPAPIGVRSAGSHGFSGRGPPAFSES